MAYFAKNNWVEPEEFHSLPIVTDTEINIPTPPEPRWQYAVTLNIDADSFVVEKVDMENINKTHDTFWKCFYTQQEAIQEAHRELKHERDYLINYDRHGYSIGFIDVSDWHDREVAIAVANYQNLWWEKLEQDTGTLTTQDVAGVISGSYEIRRGKYADIEKEVALHDCRVAWNNGNDHCQCGYEDCPYNQES
jgi:hypothetical protein